MYSKEESCLTEREFRCRNCRIPGRVSGSRYTKWTCANTSLVPASKLQTVQSLFTALPMCLFIHLAWTVIVKEALVAGKGGRDSWRLAKAVLGRQPRWARRYSSTMPIQYPTTIDEVIIKRLILFPLLLYPPLPLARCYIGISIPISFLGLTFFGTINYIQMQNTFILFYFCLQVVSSPRPFSKISTSA